MRAQRRLRDWRKASNLGVDQMSIRIMTWAWSVALPPTSKLVLMALADIADDRGVCWPSHPTLAAKCSLTDRTVRRILVLLQTHKLVVVEPRFKATGSQTSNRYRLAVDTPPDKLSGGTRTPMVAGDGHPCPGAPDTVVLRTTTEPSIEPSQLLPPPSPPRMPSHYPRCGGGDLCYPKSLTLAQRHALHDRLAVLTQDQAQQILDELSGRLAIAQVKNPLRYCAVLIKRMQRGMFFPELGLNVAGAREAETARHALLARIENVAAIASSAQRRALPPRQREAIRRIRTISSTRPRKGD
jgi:Helix-turn-helix domain